MKVEDIKEEPIKEEVKKEPIEEEPKDVIPYIDVLRIRKLYGANWSIFEIDGILSAAQKTDLTDGGASTAHKHDHGGQDGLGGDDHSQYHNNARGNARYLYKENTNAFTPDGNYEPATKKYVDDNIGGPATEYYASDTLRHSNDAEKQTTGEGSMEKIKQIDCGFDLSQIRVKYTYRITDINQVGTFRVYINGAPDGAQRTESNKEWQTFSQDFSGIGIGYDIQVYAQTTSDDFPAQVKDFRLYYDHRLVIDTTFTNEDP